METVSIPQEKTFHEEPRSSTAWVGYPKQVTGQRFFLHS